MTSAARDYASKTANAALAFHDVTEKSAAQAKENFEKFSAANSNAADAMKNAYFTAMKGAQNYNAKVIEFAQSNTAAAFAFARELSGVKSPSEFFALSAERSRQQFEELCRQAKVLSELAQNASAESTERLQAGVSKALNQRV